MDVRPHVDSTHNGSGSTSYFTV